MPSRVCAVHVETALRDVFAAAPSASQGTIDDLEQAALTRYLFHRPLHHRRGVGGRATSVRRPVASSAAAPRVVVVVSTLLIALLVLAAVIAAWIM